MLFIRWKRLVAAILLLGIIFCCVLAVFTYLLLTRSLPAETGEIYIEGIRKDVKIYRDAFGVPHIFAANEQDLMFAAGYVQAQDRLWQMDMLRRLSQGKLSEVFGSRTLSADRTMRTIGLHRTALAVLDSLDPVSVEMLADYCAGINYYIEKNNDKLPLEFDALDYKPALWYPEDCISTSRLIAWFLNMGWYVDLAYGKIIDSVGYYRASEIFPDYPADAPVIVKDYKLPEYLKTHFTVPEENIDTVRGDAKKETATAAALLDEFYMVNSMIRRIAGFEGLGFGSNNWAISGSKTASGKPIIANDPHLPLTVPSLWYEMHLAGGRFDVTGFAVPGLPFIVIGNNRHIAWAFTHGMIDEADFYTERIRNGEYQVDKLWFPLKIIKENIAVRDSATVSIETAYTRHGPIITKVNPLTENDSAAIAMQWNGNYRSNEVAAFRKLNTARSWDEMREAMKTYGVPVQNMVYADINGNIGYQCVGRIPVRKGFEGLRIMDGKRSYLNWSGFVEFDDLPRSYNPPEGYVATANNRLIEQRDFYFSRYWEHPSRIKRIIEWLQSREHFTINDVSAMQEDIYSYHAMEVVPYLIEACIRDTQLATNQPDPRSLNPYQESFLYIKSWDGQMDQESRGALIFNAFFQNLIRNIYHDELGDSVYKAFIQLSNVPTRVTTPLLAAPWSGWWDNVLTRETERRDDILKQTFIQTVDQLMLQYRSGPSSWKWGEKHYIKMEHPFGQEKWFDYIYNFKAAMVPGNSTTVNKTEYAYADSTFRTIIGASMRRIVDLDDIAHPRSVLPTGQSGQAFSKHYGDQYELWLNHQLKTVTMNEMELVNNCALLILKPKNK